MNRDQFTGDPRRTMFTLLLSFFMSVWHCLCCLYPRNQNLQVDNDEECNHSQLECQETNNQKRNKEPINEASSPNLVNIQPKDAWIDFHIFQQLDRTLIVKLSSLITLKPPSNVGISPGATFLAYCANTRIHDNVIPILIPKGFYPNSHGQFTLNEEVNELECPICRQMISNNNPVGIGFRDCVVTIKYRDTDGKADQFKLKSDKDTFAFAKFLQPGCVKYHFIKFIIDST